MKTIGNFNLKSNRGFTIVELLIVIVVIGILAAITIVSYTGLTKKATEVGVISDLDSAKKQLELYKTEYGTYPISIDSDKCPTAPINDPKYCLKDKTFEYTPTADGSSYNLKLTRNDISFQVNDISSPRISCPVGFIVVPGSPTYNQGDFCIMKYEAKNAGGNIPTSTAAGYPWVNISQTNAISYSSNVANCTGCHLVTEAERMTLAQNILSVDSNWSGGVVGSGYIFSGHNDNAPANALEADTDDLNGYVYETNTGGNQRRTLKLTNGEVIWDLAGNVHEWTSSQISGSGNYPGIQGAGYAWREWPDVTNTSILSINPTPTGTGIAGSSTWTSINGIGKMYSNYDETILHGFLRGGHYYSAANAGVLALNLSNTPAHESNTLGFRVSK